MACLLKSSNSGDNKLLSVSTDDISTTTGISVGAIVGGTVGENVFITDGKIVRFNRNDGLLVLGRKDGDFAVGVNDFNELGDDGADAEVGRMDGRLLWIVGLILGFSVNIKEVGSGEDAMAGFGEGIKLEYATGLIVEL